jgi:hypothetical protein
MWLLDQAACAWEGIAQTEWSRGPAVSGWTKLFSPQLPGSWLLSENFSPYTQYLRTGKI